MFPWEPEGCYCCTKSMAKAPFWFSMEHCWTALMPFWLLTDNIVTLEPEGHYCCSTIFQYSKVYGASTLVVLNLDNATSLSRDSALLVFIWRYVNAALAQMGFLNLVSISCVPWMRNLISVYTLMSLVQCVTCITGTTKSLWIFCSNSELLRVVFTQAQNVQLELSFEFLSF